MHRLAFGTTVRALRVKEGMRQADLARTLGIGRSTLANVERGAERPSERFWWAVRTHLPHWTPTLSDLYAAARSPRLHPARPVVPVEGGPFDLVSVSYVYLFRDAPGPHEVIEVRRIRATESGATAFGLRLDHGDPVDLGQEALWGGSIDSSRHTDDTGHVTSWTRVEFGRSLRVGQTHEFAIRSWIEQPADPLSHVGFQLGRAPREASIHASFRGALQPSSVWAYGPVSSDAHIPRFPSGQRRLKVSGGGTSVVVRRPIAGQGYGVAWEWVRPEAERRPAPPAVQAAGGAGVGVLGGT